jgi:hypothetical protein
VTRVVVLGGGFAGLEALRVLERRLGGRPDVELLLVSDRNYALFTPLLPQVASSLVEPRHIVQPIRDLRGSRRFRFRRDEVHAAGSQVHARHPVAPEAEPAAAPDVADGLDDVAGLDQRGGHLRQQRREEQVVLVAHQQQLDVGAAAQPALEHAHRLDPTEPAAEKEHAWPLVRHVPVPHTRNGADPPGPPTWPF